MLAELYLFTFSFKILTKEFGIDRKKRKCSTKKKTVNTQKLLFIIFDRHLIYPPTTNKYQNSFGNKTLFRNKRLCST